MKQKYLILALLIVIALPAVGYLFQRSGFNPYPNVKQGDFVTSGMPMMQSEPATGTVTNTARGEAGMGMMADESMILPPEPGYQGFAPNEDRTVIKTASLALLTNDTNKLVADIKSKVTEFGGTVTSSNIFENEIMQYQRSGTGVNANMTLRVPADHLDDTLAAIKTLALKVTSEQVQAVDETEQRVDMEAQLRNLRATETQFLDLLDQAKNVEETLQVQRELTSIRTQIEQLEARMQNLQGAAAMSTINVSISTSEADLPILDPQRQSLGEEIRIAFKDMVTIYRNLAVHGLRLAIIASPILILAGIAYAVVKKRDSQTEE